MNLTKTDFKEYLLCKEGLWLKKKRPEDYTAGEFSLFLEKLIGDGYEVEEYVHELFPGGILLEGDEKTLLSDTQKLLAAADKPIFQATFKTDDGLFVKIDVLNFNKETGKWDIYEVKASSEIKTDVKHNHIKDITFQSIVAQRAGVPVGESYIIHINKGYRRDGELDLRELFVFANVSEEVSDIRELVESEIENALTLLSQESIPMDSCGCLYKSSAQRCDSFEFFNPNVPKYSVHNMFRGQKLALLVDESIFDIADIPDDFEMTANQKKQVDMQKSKHPLIDRQAIEDTLSSLEFPLYFLDYETFGKPVPLLDGYRTNQQVVFQVSLHVLESDGALKHFEYLAETLENATSGLVKTLKENIGPVGSVIVWNESFEKGRNKELAELHPEYKEFLEDVNSRVFDLMKVFKKDYLHPDFNGSASIKNVLPVLLPELSYKALDIQNGTMAMTEWERMLAEHTTDGDKTEIKKNLLKYCKLDTLAMVEIYKKVKEL
jgi:CRISPR/Cas system-associated exonuclease Cas4 (RecB family)